MVRWMDGWRDGWGWVNRISGHFAGEVDQKTRLTDKNCVKQKCDGTS